MFASFLKSLFGLGFDPAPRRKRPRRSVGPCAAIESLESRVLPAGNVLATVAGGSVVLHGDSAANDVKLLATDAGVVLRGMNGTTVNGSAGDAVLFAGQSQVNGSLVAFLGSGNDVLHVDDVAIGHDLVVYGGKGNDDLGVTFAAIGGNLVFVGQDGHDRLFIQETVVHLNVVADLGSGDDLLAVQNSTVAHSVIAVGAKGSDQIAIDLSAVGHSVVGVLGRGQNDVRLMESTVGHNVVLVGGADKDVVKIEDSTIDKSLVAVAGRGKDSVWITGESSIGRSLVAHGGRGNDSLQIDSTVLQPDRLRTRSFESATVDPVLLAVRMDDPTIGVTAAVQRARDRFVAPATFSIDFSANSPVPSNGVVIVTDPTISISVTGTPGLTVEVDRDGDGAFDDGSVTLGPQGTGVIQTQLLHNDANRGLNHLVIRGVRNGEPIALPPQEIDVHFAIGTVVRFDTELGSYDVELLDADAPVTVQNFLNYSARYAGSIIHRSAHTGGGGDFVIQGGGFDLVPPLTPISTDAPISNEFNPAKSNVRGTVAMALPGNNINGATSQWFVNVANNTFLDAGSFTVFGRVIGEGLAVVDAIHDLPTFNISGALNNSALAEVPLIGYTPFTLPLTGTVTTTTGSTVVTGAGTQFTQELIGGAAVQIDGVAYTVASVNSATQLTLSTPAVTTGSNTTAFTNAAPQNEHYVTLPSIASL